MEGGDIDTFSCFVFVVVVFVVGSLAGHNQICKNCCSTGRQGSTHTVRGGGMNEGAHTF